MAKSQLLESSHSKHLETRCTGWSQGWLFCEKLVCMRRRSDDRLLIFFSKDISLFLPYCPHVCILPAITSQSNTNTQTKQRTKISIFLLPHTPSLGSMGSSFGWSTLIAGGHSQSLALCREKKKGKKNYRLSHSSNQHLAKSNSRELSFFLLSSLFFFLFIFLTNNSPVPSSQVGQVICLSLKTNPAHRNPSECASFVEVSHHSFKSMTYSAAAQYNTTPQSLADTSHGTEKWQFSF